MEIQEKQDLAGKGAPAPAKWPWAGIRLEGLETAALFSRVYGIATVSGIPVRVPRISMANPEVPPIALSRVGIIHGISIY